MKKYKIYIDTSVISHLDAPDVPDRQTDTLQLWKEIKEGKYEVYISTVVLEEINQCAEPKKTNLIDFLNQIDFTIIQPKDNEEIKNLENSIINQKILTEKSRDDCTHIACAVVNECDMIVSWNFKHMVNIRTINGIRAINISNGYKMIDIYPPVSLIALKGDNNDE